MHPSLRIAAFLTVGLFTVSCDGTTDGEPTEDPVVDADEDGVEAAMDCDDNDATLGSVSADADCDGILTAADCDDNDNTSTAIADDGDCDGTLTADDCNDADAMSTTVATDADCDTVLTADDCDDNDDMSTTVATDADCDSVLTADDCDDNDETLLAVADDADCDGALTVDDCDDADPTRNPDAPEIPGNEIDENCDKLDSGEIVLNEVLYDPSGDEPGEPGDGGDANYDGIREAQGDEFVELVNVEDFAIDVSGYEMFDRAALADRIDDEKALARHLVPDGTILQAGQALVVFGHGSPGIESRAEDPDVGMVTNDFGGSIVQVAMGFDSRLNLNNGNDSFIMWDSFGNELININLDSPAFESNPDVAYTRDPDLTGPLVLATTLDKNVWFTPGTQNDGTPF